MRTLHVVGTIAWGVAWGGIIHYFGASEYFAGYTTGAFFMLYYFIGLRVIEEYEANNLL